jgi:hypothetical protein
MSVLAPLLVGFCFGWLLQKGGLSRYERIVGVFRLDDALVLQFLLSALLTSWVGIRLLQDLGMAVPVPVPETYLVGNLLGGVVFGVGMALSGFCPGTVAAGAGEGRLDYLVPGGIGLYSGAVVNGLLYERVMPRLTGWGRLGRVTLPMILRCEPWLAIVLFAELTVLTLVLVQRGRRWVRPSATARP